MDKEVIRSVINDAIQEANNRAVEAYEKAVQEYYNHRGQYYEDEVYNLLPYVDSYGFIDERGNSMFPYDVRDNFSIPFMNGDGEKRLFSEEVKETIDDYNALFEGGDWNIDAMRVASAMRFHQAIDAIKTPGNEPHTEDYLNFIEGLRYEISYTSERPETLSDNKGLILRRILERENASVTSFLEYNKTKLIDYDQIILDSIKDDARLNGEHIDVDIEDIYNSGAEYTATKAIINNIRPEEFDENMMEILYEHKYQGGFSNPIIEEKYQKYVTSRENTGATRPEAEGDEGR